MAPTGLQEPLWSSRLSEMEDEQVVARARAGSVQATEHLLRKYRGFVEGKARSYFLAGAEIEDVVQEGMIGLYKAIRDFRADKLAQFRSFAELCVTRQIITAVKSATRNKHVPLNDYISLQRSGADNGSEGCLLDVVADHRVADPERLMLELRTLQFVQREALEGLSDLELGVLRAYLTGTTYQKMAMRMGCSVKAVDNALQRAKRKVGRKLCELN